MIIKKWTLVLNQPQKLAQEVKIAQDHIKRPTDHIPTDIGCPTTIKSETRL